MDRWLTDQCPTCHRQEEGQAAIKVAKKSDGGAGEVRGGVLGVQGGTSVKDRRMANHVREYQHLVPSAGLTFNSPVNTRPFLFL